jgi:hypothetical protein
MAFRVLMFAFTRSGNITRAGVSSLSISAIKYQLLSILIYYSRAPADGNKNRKVVGIVRVYRFTISKVMTLAGSLVTQKYP